MKYCMPWTRKTNNTGKILLGALAGMAAGLTAGLLTAPRTGRETRRLVSDRTNETLHKVGKTLSDTKDKALKKGKETVEEITSSS